MLQTPHMSYLDKQLHPNSKSEQNTRPPAQPRSQSRRSTDPSYHYIKILLPLNLINRKAIIYDESRNLKKTKYNMSVNRNGHS